MRNIILHNHNKVWRKGHFSLYKPWTGKNALISDAVRGRITRKGGTLIRLLWATQRISLSLSVPLSVSPYLSPFSLSLLSLSGKGKVTAMIFVQKAGTASEGQPVRTKVCVYCRCWSGEGLGSGGVMLSLSVLAALNGRHAPSRQPRSASLQKALQYNKRTNLAFCVAR